MKRRRRTVSPEKVRAALGFYSKIEASQAGWPSCASCGRKTALVGEHGECLRCQLERRRQAREGESAAGKG